MKTLRETYLFPAIMTSPMEGVTVFDAPNGTFRSGVQFLIREDNGGTKNILVSDYSGGDGRTLVVGLYLK